MSITQERTEQIAGALSILVQVVNDIDEDELLDLIHTAEMKATMDPFIDPTRYRIEADSIYKSKNVLRALLTFKQQVKGIGAFV